MTSERHMVHAFMYKHFLLQEMFPQLVKLVLFPYVIHVNGLIYTI